MQVGENISERVRGDDGYLADGLTVMLVADGVVETEETGVEGDAAVGIGAGIAVFEVTLDGATHVGQLAAYLVVAAGVELNLEEVVAAGGGGEETVVEDGELGN